MQHPWPGFTCPLCASRTYRNTELTRPSGGVYTAPFFQCDGCSTMFADPVKFTECESEAGKLLPRSLEDK